SFMPRRSAQLSDPPCVAGRLMEMGSNRIALMALMGLMPLIDHHKITSIAKLATPPIQIQMFLVRLLIASPSSYSRARPRPSKSDRVTIPDLQAFAEFSLLPCESLL